MFWRKKKLPLPSVDDIVETTVLNYDARHHFDEIEKGWLRVAVRQMVQDLQSKLCRAS